VTGAGPDLPDGPHQALLDVLAVARSLHFLGAADLSAHIRHSLAFAVLVPEPPVRAVDLGSGGGIPGLVLAALWPESTWLLVDANERRTTFLRDAVNRLDFGFRVEVLVERTEVVGHDPEWRGQADLVVARGFGPPAVTAENGAPLLRPGGALVVADPPGGAPDRWPPDKLRLLGLVHDGHIVEPVALQRFRLVEDCPDRYPRRVGIPTKRPLFS
jgi:16S rRNA (guanine527-N7)-methyltransferase